MTLLPSRIIPADREMRELWLLSPRRSARKHGCHTFLVDIEAHKRQRLTAWIAPLMHETIRLVDQRTRPLCFRLPADGIRAGPRNDIVQSASGPIMWGIGGHPGRE